MNTNMCIYVNILENNYTKSIYYFEISNKINFGKFKELIYKRFDILSFNILFVAMHLDSDDNNLNNKLLDFFLFKNESIIKIISKNNDKSDLTNSKISRLLNSNECKKMHYVAYNINKPVIIKKQYDIYSNLKYVYIITPNGSLYEGQLYEIFDKLYKLGYKYKSCAIDNEINTVKYLNNSYYLF